MNPTSSPSKRRFPVIAGAVLAALFVLAGIGALIAKIVLSPDRLRQSIVKASTEALGVEPSLESVSLQLVPFGVKLRSFSIPNTGAGDPPLLAFDEGRIRLSLLPLLVRRLVVDELRLTRPVVHLRREGKRLVLPGSLGAPASGTSNRSEASRGAPLPTFLSQVAVRSYGIDAGSIRVVGANDSTELDLAGITLKGKLGSEDRGTRITSRGEISLESLSIAALALYRETLDQLKPVLRYDLAYSAIEGTLTIESASLVAKPLEISGAGAVRDLLRSPVLHFAVESRTYELSELLPLVPSAIIPEGRRPTGSGRVELGGEMTSFLADSTRTPEIRARIAFDDAALGLQSFPAALENLGGAIEAVGDTIRIHELAGTLSGEPFQVNGFVAHPSSVEKAAYDLVVRMKTRLDLLEKAGFAPPGGHLSGSLVVDVTAQGEGVDPARTSLAGTVLAEDVVVRMPDLRLPFEEGRAHVRLEGHTAYVDQFAARIGRSSFDAKGVIQSPLAKPVFTWSGRAPMLDLNELFPPPSTNSPAAEHSRISIPFVGPAFATPNEPLPLVPVVPPFDMSVDLEVDSLLTGQNVFTGGRFHATTHHAHARVDGTFAGALLGNVSMRDLTAGVDIKAGRLDGTFSAPRADAPLVPLTGVKGRIQLAEDRVLRLNDMTASLWSGAVAGDATIDLTDLASPAFRIESKATRVQANDLISSLTPAKDIMTGTMDLSSIISGRGSVPEAIARTLSGDGLLKAQGGNLQLGPTVSAIWSALGVEGKSAVDFRDLAAAFSLEDGRIVTKDVVIRGNDADWKAAGSIGFDGILDYDVEVQLSDALSTSSRKRLGRDLTALLEGTSGRLTLDLKVVGNAKSPRVTVDTSKLAERAKETARAALQKGVEKHAQDILGRIGGLGSPHDSSDSSGVGRPESTAVQVKDLLKGLFKKK